MKKAAFLFLFFCIVASADAQSNNGIINQSTGVEILNLLPPTLSGQNANAKRDRVEKGSGFIGVVVHKDYGSGQKNISLELINNSPSLSKVNDLLATPAGSSSPFIQTEVSGYKALLQPFYGEGSVAGFELLIPINKTLITLKSFNHTQDQILAMAKTLPLAAIAKKLQ